MKFYYLFLLLIFKTLPTHAQNDKNIDHQNILWTRYYNQLLLSEKWALHSEIDNRIFLKPIQQNVFVLRLQARYKVSKQVETGFGFAYFSVDTQIPEVNPNFNIPEYRGQQDMTWRASFSTFSISQRFQVEERFIQKANQQEVLQGTSFAWRFRYRLQIEYPIWKKLDQHLKVVFSDEIMFNSGKENRKNTFDQNRIYAAVHCNVNPHFANEVGYINSFQRRASGFDFFNRDIVRLSIFYKIKLNKKV